MSGYLPPRVIHIGYGKKDNLAAIASDAATALHMGKGERSLLLFYATCSSGFRPSLRSIANTIGQNRSQVYRNRNALVGHGLASLEGDCITLHWRRISLYATLDPRLTNKRCYTAPAIMTEPNAANLTPNDVDSLPFERLLPILGSMTESQYEALRRKIKEEKKNDLVGQWNEGGWHLSDRWAV